VSGASHAFVWWTVVGGEGIEIGLVGWNRAFGPGGLEWRF
jgi:hypothetical protein